MADSDSSTATTFALAPSKATTVTSPPPVVDPEHESMRNEVMPKMGRNLLLFQQLERMLKFLIANNSLAGHAPMKQPYIEQRADRSETLANVKARAMAHFHLSEGAIDGGSKAYSLSFEDVIQTNLSVTLGELAKHHELALLLVEQFTQGYPSTVTGILTTLPLKETSPWGCALRLTDCAGPYMPGANVGSQRDSRDAASRLRPSPLDMID